MIDPDLTILNKKLKSAFNIIFDQINNKETKTERVELRRISLHWLFHETKKTTTDIAFLIGTSNENVIHDIQMTRELIKRDKDFIIKYEQLKSEY